MTQKLYKRTSEAPWWQFLLDWNT